MAFDEEAALRRCGGNREFLMELLDDFIQLFSDAPQVVRRHLDAGQIDQVLAFLHGLRGAGANLGLLQVAAAAQQLEQSLKDKHQDPALELKCFDEAMQNLFDLLLEKANKTTLTSAEASR